MKAPKCETTQERMTRKATNAYLRSISFAKKVPSLTKAHDLEMKIRTRKQEFGVQYMDILLKEGEDSTAFAECILRAKTDIGALQARIDEFKGQASSIDEATKERLIAKKRPPPVTPTPSEDEERDDILKETIETISHPVEPSMVTIAERKEDSLGRQVEPTKVTTIAEVEDSAAITKQDSSEGDNEKVTSSSMHDLD